MLEIRQIQHEWRKELGFEICLQICVLVIAGCCGNMSIVSLIYLLSIMYITYTNNFVFI